jgi:hypothetical protein
MKKIGNGGTMKKTTTGTSGKNSEDGTRRTGTPEAGIPQQGGTDGTKQKG